MSQTTGDQATELYARAEACERHDPPLLNLARYLRSFADAKVKAGAEEKRQKRPFEDED